MSFFCRMKYLLFGLLFTAVLAAGCDKPAAPSTPITPSPILELSKGNQNDAAATANGEAVKATLEKMFELAKSGNCAQMASMFALRNSNTEEDWKRGLRYDVPAEKANAEKNCAQIQAMMMGLKAYTFLEFVQEKESEGEWNIWTVRMDYEDGSHEEKAFAFLPAGNGFILGDID
jgi:hypothetical protein